MRTFKMADDTERLRRFINMQYVKMRRVAAIGSLILLAINVAFTVYPFLSGTFEKSYIGIPIIFLTIILVIWLAAHIYVNKMEMYRTEQLAEVTLNPYAIYAVTPYEEMIYRTKDLPLMKALKEILPDGEHKNELQQSIKKVENWVKLGYIPKKEFPKHLERYYITNKERRL